MMTITDLKSKFQKELLSLYQKEEIDSFFYLLTEHRIGFNRLDIALGPTANISTIDEQYFLLGLNKLKKEIPVQYIIGETEFFGLPFFINKDVLIPRPETEELVEWAIKKTKETRNKNKNKHDANQELKIIDIGSGSGCIAIALAKNIPNASIWALDVSEKAIKVAQKNATLNKVDVQFLHLDILKINSLQKTIKNSLRQAATKHKTISSLPITTRPPGNDKLKFDIIISNPPYVRELEKNEIKNNVIQNEPHLALFVQDGNPLLFYDKIVDFAIENLKSNGELYFEINQYLGKETKELLEKKGFQNIELRKDIFGNDRMIFSSFALCE